MYTQVLNLQYSNLVRPKTHTSSFKAKFMIQSSDNIVKK
ncbi:conserved hypothetical protein (plasmid) [Borreliella valaisiana VS116]|uniref:Uncharacterized protein n=1 Tax=Borreliella valaisiana VS116 TaxID=445987 RepID=C0R985_BORVA|nr:conserved hypothetical protein [Borreliella valaisiana VS116]